MASTKYYSNCSIPLSTGCFLYTDSGLTTPVSNGYYSNGTTCYTVTGGSGEITTISSCPTTTTTVAGQQIDIFLSDQQATVCNGTQFNNVYILPSATFGPGTVIYYDAACTSPMNNTNTYFYVVLNPSSAQTIYDWDGTTGTIGSAVGTC